MRLAGCGILRGLESREPAPWVPAGMVQPGSNAEYLLLYFQHVRRLSGTELAKEHDAARQSFTRSRADFDRVRLAMMLSLPGAAFSDDGRALELLDPLSKDHDGPLQGLAYLLATHLQERRRLDKSAQGLQQKLDALKSLERSMIERKR